MKKLILLWFLVLLVGCSTSEEDTTNQDDMADYLVDQAVLQDKFDNNETFLLVLAETWCGHCQNYKREALTPYVTNNPTIDVVIIYLEENFSDNEARNNFFTHNGIYNFRGTPTTYYVKDGEVIDSVSGAMSLNNLKQFIGLHQ